VAFVGRSNVGKSSLINALVRQRIARTSAEPGKTRLANVYLVTRGAAAPFYLLDLPGYGYARAARPVTGSLRGGRAGAESREDARASSQAEFETIVRAVFEHGPAGLLLVDARHPGLESDRAAWQWVSASADRAAVVATKIDKLGRGERIRALRELESVFEGSVVPVSAATGEGLDQLWKLIDRLTKSG
jgi:GTP-binding protein